MTTALTIWLITLAFFLTHQLEEVVYSIAAWSQVHPRPGWRRWTAWMSRSPMASPDLRTRAGTVGAQILGITLLGAATSGSLIATQLAATVLTTGLMLAFVMHITVSVLTHSAMPGADHVDLAGASRGGGAADLRLDPLIRIQYPEGGRRDEPTGEGPLPEQQLVPPSVP